MKPSILSFSRLTAILTNAQNVGIGTPNPLNKLQEQQVIIEKQQKLIDDLLETC